MKFRIVTPDGVIYEDDIEKVSIPTTTGDIMVLENHVPLLSLLKAGEMVIYKADHTVSLAISQGMLEVHHDHTVSVLADTAERAEHIDISRAEEARKRAEALLTEQEHVADVDFARLQAKMEKELARISVGKKYRG